MVEFVAKEAEGEGRGVVGLEDTGIETYTTAEFAGKAHVSVRTVRYYDAIGLLKPSCYDSKGCRCYTEEDFFRLQKVLSLKFLGFSLKEIEQLTHGNGRAEIKELLDMQIRLVHKKMDNLRQVEAGLKHAGEIIETRGALEWEDVINLMYLMDMEEQLLKQYQNSENIAVRIRLHSACSTNRQGWFPWLMSQIRVGPGSKLLELGCGSGELWRYADKAALSGGSILLSDISAGMIRDAMSNLGSAGFRYAVFDCADIPYGENEFDGIIANHMLFYIKNMAGALREVCRVLMPEGSFYCSTYGEQHMKEIRLLAKEFDSRIELSEIELYKIFGIENGGEILKEHFSGVSFREYTDSLEIGDVDLLCSYIYSCHGNQNELLRGRKEEFRQFLLSRMCGKKLSVTKEAGVFVCEGPKK